MASNYTYSWQLINTSAIICAELFSIIILENLFIVCENISRGNVNYSSRIIKILFPNFFILHAWLRTHLFYSDCAKWLCATSFRLAAGKCVDLWNRTLRDPHKRVWGFISIREWVLRLYVSSDFWHSYDGRNRKFSILRRLYRYDLYKLGISLMFFYRMHWQIIADLSISAIRGQGFNSP